MKPFKFRPYLKSTIWGGSKIAPFKGVSTDLENIGESWEISAVPGNESVVADRGLRDDADVGKTLPELIEEYKGALVGDAVYAKFGSRFPLLVKFIDSRQNLSVQVHPDDELAAKRHNCPGKTEMWYIIKTDPGAKIFAGLRKSITPGDFEKMVSGDQEGNPFEDVIACQESHDGDLYFLPAGRLHAIGAGNFLAEIQETSDITYRVYDFGRKDANGRPRELHTALAKDAIDYRVMPEYRSSYDTTKPVSELVSSPFFKVSRVIVQSAAEVDFKSESFVVAMCIGGEANVNGVEVRQGETLLVPADENVLRVFGNATFLTATM